MITIENQTWKEKVSDSLMDLYEHTRNSVADRPHRIMLNYQGDLRKLPDEIEVLSVIDGWVQIQIYLTQLPDLASMHEVLSLSNHAFLQNNLIA